MRKQYSASRHSNFISLGQGIFDERTDLNFIFGFDKRKYEFLHT